MAERIKNMREVLIQAGIEEINTHGVAEFSIRRVANSCNISCAAPYKHFKDKREFIAATVMAAAACIFFSYFPGLLDKGRFKSRCFFHKFINL